MLLVLNIMLFSPWRLRDSGLVYVYLLLSSDISAVSGFVSLLCFLFSILCVFFRYFSSFWSWVEIINFILSIVVIFLQVHRVFLVDDLSAGIANDSCTYASFQVARSLDVVCDFNIRIVIQFIMYV